MQMLELMELLDIFQIKMLFILTVLELNTFQKIFKKLFEIEAYKQTY